MKLAVFCSECGATIFGDVEDIECTEILYDLCAYCERDKLKREKLARELEDETEPAEHRYTKGIYQKKFRHSEDLELENRRHMYRDECEWLDEKCEEKIGDDT